MNLCFFHQKTVLHAESQPGASIYASFVAVTLVSVLWDLHFCWLKIISLVGFPNRFDQSNFMRAFNRTENRSFELLPSRWKTILFVLDSNFRFWFFRKQTMKKANSQKSFDQTLEWYLSDQLWPIRLTLTTKNKSFRSVRHVQRFVNSQRWS